MIKKILKAKFIFLILFITLFISMINFYAVYLLTPGPLLNPKVVIIPKKLSIHKISTQLKSFDVIRYPKLFWLISTLYSLKYPLKSGEYKFTTKISPLQVLNILSTGKSIVHKLIVPEGVMVSEVLAKVNAEERLFGEMITKVPEGYLMPSTYFFSYGDQKEQIIDQMRKLMSAQLDIAMSKLSADSPLKTRMEVLILASIVEKETANDEERPLVAAVFLNRLKKGMKLQADPTTIYGITEGKFKLSRLLTRKDLSLQSPYNTYYIFNLPPGPIACPGIKSLQAVVNPAKTSALYFVVNGMGGHNFSSTLEDHNQHVENYRKLRDSK
ncbi:endolytic transglycosylase MltG [Candidatus Trichorickettsia mobilis]|nr:endolytic transglycosylase MltG [Candidatus Trichorickettsia mobilis]